MSEAIKELLDKYGSKIHNRRDLEKVKRVVCKQFQVATLLNSDIWKEYQTTIKAGGHRFKDLEESLKKRSVRTMSGVAPVAVLTKPYPCPGHCAYCPHEPDVPVSYLPNEPAVMRAIRCDYDPFRQVVWRLKSLENNGHHPTKIELIVIGGTWSYLPTAYKYWYVANCFKAANDYSRLSAKMFDSAYNKSTTNNLKIFKPISAKLGLSALKLALAKEQHRNETSRYNIIGLTLETRPDYINKAEVVQMRELGCTRVEIGVQIVDDDILKLNLRGHGVLEIEQATRLMKQYGLKITYHLMPALPGATPIKDFQLFKRLFEDERFQPDQIKFYPTVVTKGSLLYQWYRQGKYKPYSDKTLQDLIIRCKAVVPVYVRIMRLIRDIPGESIIAGNKITNLRQVLQKRGVKCSCIRCREAKQGNAKSYKINILTYQASGGREYFISADSLDKEILFGFCRLRIDKNSPIATAIVRELHVYGELAPIGQKKLVQHRGLGKKLLKQAEKKVFSLGFKKIAVISGVGVRSYYRKLGYRLQGGYMVKSVK